MTELALPWKSFITTCREYVETGDALLKSLQDVTDRLVWSKWNLGSMVNAHENNYGDHLCERIAEELPIDVSEVHRCKKFAFKYPEVSHIESLISSRYTWTRIVRELLPVGEEKKNNVLDFNEISHKQLIKFVDNGVEEEHRVELTGFLKKRCEEDFDLLRKVDGDAVLELDESNSGTPPTIGTSSPAIMDIMFSVMMASPGDYKYFQAWVRSRPCVVCGLESYEGHDIVFAHYPSTAGSKARTEEHRGIPLCVTHHDFQHAQGIETFMDHYGDRVLKWLQDELFSVVMVASGAKVGEKNR